MSQCKDINIKDPEGMRELLSLAGYADKAIDYYLDKSNMGTLTDADQVTELTGPCGDTMKIFLKLEDDKIKDAKIQVLGCPAAIASAMAAMDHIRGMSLDEAMKLKDAEIFKMLEDLPDQKQHCIRLTVKTLQKAIEEYKSKDKIQGE